MLVSEFKELLSAVPDYFIVDVFSVEIGNGNIFIKGDGFESSTDTEGVVCHNCDTEIDAPVIYRMEPRPKTLPLTEQQEREAKDKLRELDNQLMDILNIALQLKSTNNEIRKAWRPE